MKILVTGGTGFVGTAILHELRTRGLDVRALVRSTRSAERVRTWGVEPAFGDVRDAASLLAAARGCSHVIHLVAVIRKSDKRTAHRNHVIVRVRRKQENPEPLGSSASIRMEVER